MYGATVVVNRPEAYVQRVPLSVEVPSAGERLSALLYLPEGAGPHPAVVLGGGWCYVKELVQPHLRAGLRRNGFAALIFDYRYMGGSTGEPRQHIDPWQQIEDYRNAVSYMESRDDVDADRIGAWGISYSGGHVLILGALDARVRAVCGVVRPSTAGRTCASRTARSASGASRRRSSTRGASSTRPASTPTSRTSPSRRGTWPSGRFRRARSPSSASRPPQAPAYDGRSTVASAELLLAYDVMPFARRLAGTPTMLAVAEGDDHTHWDLAADVFDAIPGQRKRWHVVPRSGHLTLYEDADTRRAVAAVAADWFRTHV